MTTTTPAGAPSGADAATYTGTMQFLTGLSAALDQLRAELDAGIASVQSKGVQGQALDAVIAIADHLDAANAAATSAVSTVETEHALMHEAVSATPTPAATDYYRD